MRSSRPELSIRPRGKTFQFRNSVARDSWSDCRLAETKTHEQERTNENPPSVGGGRAAVLQSSSPGTRPTPDDLRGFRRREERGGTAGITRRTLGVVLGANYQRRREQAHDRYCPRVQ